MAEPKDTPDATSRKRSWMVSAGVLPISLLMAAVAVNRLQQDLTDTRRIITFVALLLFVSTAAMHGAILARKISERQAK